MSMIKPSPSLEKGRLYDRKLGTVSVARSLPQAASADLYLSQLTANLSPIREGKRTYSTVETCVLCPPQQHQIWESSSLEMTTTSGCTSWPRQTWSRPKTEAATRASPCVAS